MVLLYTGYLGNKGVYTVLQTYFASAGDTENCYYTQDTREQRNVGIPLLLGYPSNRTLILAIGKKMTKFSNWKRILETQNDEKSSK